MSDALKKRIDEDEIDTILAEDIDFTGELKFKAPLMIKGKFKGEIKASNDLYIGENADIEAKIDADMISSRGKIKGNISAKKRIELFSTAKVEGDITCPDLVIESGAKYDGYCNMVGEPRKKNAN
ncbi:MAG: polymer-forming cytoskeletal protein [Spirochaetales bacterium]|nr:polymer-forming cytoskeletal protein [Spirochaetales bacterium]